MKLYNSILKINKKYYLPCWILYMDLIETKDNPEAIDFYDWDTIFLATQKYISEYESKNFEYMRTAQYFIRKQNLDKSWDSDLATYCEFLKDNPDDDVDTFSELIV